MSNWPTTQPKRSEADWEELLASSKPEHTQSVYKLFTRSGDAGFGIRTSDFIKIRANGSDGMSGTEWMMKQIEDRGGILDLENYAPKKRKPTKKAATKTKKVVEEPAEQPKRHPPASLLKKRLNKAVPPDAEVVPDVASLSDHMTSMDNTLTEIQEQINSLAKLITDLTNDKFDAVQAEVGALAEQVAELEPLVKETHFGFMCLSYGDEVASEHFQMEALQEELLGVPQILKKEETDASGEE